MALAAVERMIYMSMTRDAYAKEVRKVAEAVLERNETVVCPREDCGQQLRIVQQSTLSTRSILCPVHGHIYQEQRIEPFSNLDWDRAKELADEELSELDWDEGEIEQYDN